MCSVVPFLAAALCMRASARSWSVPISQSRRQRDEGKPTGSIARAGDWRVWAEPETGGEAYIPLAGPRQRSTAISEEVARRFGLSCGWTCPLGGLPPRGHRAWGVSTSTLAGSTPIPSSATSARPSDRPVPRRCAAPVKPPRSSPGATSRPTTRLRLPGPEEAAVSGGKALAWVQSVLGEFAGTRVTSTYRGSERRSRWGAAPATDIGGPTATLGMNARLRGMGGWRGAAVADHILRGGSAVRLGALL